MSQTKHHLEFQLDKGFCVFFTGLSGAGKSTIACALAKRLREATSRPITLLDGDVARTHLSSELGFSKAHRDLNIRRLGFVASEVVKHQGIVICAAIAPYLLARQEARQMVNKWGNFFEVYVSTKLAVCEKRDVKGLYQKARNGLITNFTGINDPYEAPTRAEITIDTANYTVLDAVCAITQTIDIVN